MRGKHVTKPIEEVIREAKELIADGVRELIIVAQDTTYYGLDLYGRVRLQNAARTQRTAGPRLIILYAYQSISPTNFSRRDRLRKDSAVPGHALAAHQ